MGTDKWDCPGARGGNLAAVPRGLSPFTRSSRRAPSGASRRDAGVPQSMRTCKIIEFVPSLRHLQCMRALSRRGEGGGGGRGWLPGVGVTDRSVGGRTGATLVSLAVSSSSRVVSAFASPLPPLRSFTARSERAGLLSRLRDLVRVDAPMAPAVLPAPFLALGCPCASPSLSSQSPPATSGLASLLPSDSPLLAANPDSAAAGDSAVVRQFAQEDGLWAPPPRKRGGTGGLGGEYCLLCDGFYPRCCTQT